MRLTALSAKLSATSHDAREQAEISRRTSRRDREGAKAILIFSVNQSLCPSAALCVMLFSAISALAAVQQSARPAAPLDPIDAILGAFKNHAIVALSEGEHNNEPSHAFRLALIRDPRFAATVNDIVVEWGTARYQDVLDRFIRGESVADAELRRVWQDTTQAHQVWDVPIYEAFFRAVRTINGSLPPARQLRVLAGDPPIEWEKIRTRQQTIDVERDRFAADLIQREVLAKQRRALLVWGGTHFIRRSVVGDAARTPSSIVGLLGPATQSAIFSIWAHTSGVELTSLQPDIASWRVPAMAMTRGTTLGDAPYRSYIIAKGGDGPRMEDQFDAVLYLGPLSSITYARLAPTLCADDEYMKMRLGRLAIADPPELPVPPGVLRPADRLKRQCESVSGK
jgi:hypothetical protein